MEVTVMHLRVTPDLLERLDAEVSRQQAKVGTIVRVDRAKVVRHLLEEGLKSAENAAKENA